MNIHLNIIILVIYTSNYNEIQNNLMSFLAIFVPTTDNQIQTKSSIGKSITDVN